ncbi:MAG: sulfatase, partial [Thermoanaerobaculia bacterium]
PESTRPMTRRAARWTALAGALALAACAPPAERAPRGLVLISIDTLRADHLGAYGYHRPTSPFFDRLAERGALFERAIVQLPGTLPSHMSIFTGLYPAEHGVYPPDSVLSGDIPTLPEVLRAHGLRTAGFTEGGYVDGHYGFARGFERFAADAGGDARAIETTFAHGLDFLSGLAADQRFFLFLHTYVVHDPYDPPPPYPELFWQGAPPPDAFPPTGPNLTAVNRGTRSVSPATVRYFEALYDGSIRYLDDQLAAFFAGLEGLGLTDETAIVLTSDHGEEFLEHGKLVHQQIYQETVRVPLLVIEPGRRTGARVAALVESVDLAPTLWELAAVPAPPASSGRSLVHLLRRPADAHRGEAYSEQFGAPTRGLYRFDDGRLWHQVQARSPAVDGGHWVEREATFDVRGGRLDLALHTYHEARTLEVRVDGVRHGFFDLPLDRRIERSLALPPGFHRVTLVVPTCTSPAVLGLSVDRRCLGFRLLAGDLGWTDLFDVDADPGERVNLAERHGVVVDALAERLSGLAWRPRAAAGRDALAPELRRRLEALGYLQ